MGASTIVSISLGTVLVAGKKRVPRPAAGMTAFVTFDIALGFLKTPVERQGNKAWKGCGMPCLKTGRKKREKREALAPNVTV